MRASITEVVGVGMVVAEVGVEGAWRDVHVSYELTLERSVEKLGYEGEILTSKGEILGDAAAKIPTDFLSI